MLCYVVGAVSDGMLLIAPAVPPMFMSTSPQVDIVINSTDNVTLSCSLRGFPISNLQWMKDGTPLAPDGSHITITTFRRQAPTDTFSFSSIQDSNFEPIPQEGLEYFEAVSELTLLPPVARGDTAVYTCEAEAHFVQNYTTTSGSIFVNVSGNFIMHMHNLQPTIALGKAIFHSTVHSLHSFQ